jgi:hypothetical protein
VIFPLHPISTRSIGTIPRRHCSEHRRDHPPYRAVRLLLLRPRLHSCARWDRLALYSILVPFIRRMMLSFEF